MKQKDITIIAVVAIVSAVVAAVVSQVVIRPADKKQQAEVVQTISPDFQTPDTRFFNEKSINPTLQIQIGDSSNPDPFKGQTN